MPLGNYGEFSDPLQDAFEKTTNVNSIEFLTTDENPSVRVQSHTATGYALEIFDYGGNQTAYIKGDGSFSGGFGLTTKGDLLTRNSAANTRLPIGSDNTVLMADSTQSTGLKYKALDHATDLANVGSNSHSTIDLHLASTSNPHSVTRGQLSLDTSDAPLFAGLTASVLTGGGSGSDNLTLRSTSDVTKGSVKIDETTVATSKTTGALQVSGGIGCSGAIYCTDLFADAASVHIGSVSITNSTDDLVLNPSGAGKVSTTKGIQAASFTDGTSTISSGTIFGATSIAGTTVTDGSGASLNGGIVTGSTLTDGTLSATAGAITGSTNITASSTIQGASVKATTRVNTDEIQENTSGNGVTIDGVSLKDSNVTTTGTVSAGSVYCNALRSVASETGDMTLMGETITLTNVGVLSALSYTPAYQFARRTTASDVTLNNEVEVEILSISLTAGTWIINWHCNVYSGSTAHSNVVYVYLSTSNNAAGGVWTGRVAGSMSTFYNTTDNERFTLSGSCVVSPTGSTTYYLVTRANGSATGIIVDYAIPSGAPNDPDSEVTINAQRVSV